MCSVCFSSSDEWAVTKVHRQYMITSAASMSSEDLQYEKLKVFLCFFLPSFFFFLSVALSRLYLLFHIPTNLSSYIFSVFSTSSLLSSMTWSLYWKGSSSLIAGRCPSRSTSSRPPPSHSDTEVSSTKHQKSLFFILFSKSFSINQ